MMNSVSRRDFLSGGAAAFGTLLGGRIFAAPKGWKPKRNPNLVFGVMSDTHLMVDWDRKSIYPTMTLDYIRNAFRLFRKSKIDAFVHLGDASHRGDIREWEFHKEVFEDVFGKNGLPRRIVVVGNHDLFETSKERFPDAWQQRMIKADLARHYRETWGVPFTEVLHSEVKGYHFFGNHWGIDDGNGQHGVKMANYINEHAEEFSLKSGKPIFILSHKMTYLPCNGKLKAFPNVVGFCGHWHTSLANWHSIYYERNYGLFPYINCGACRYDGENALRKDALKEQDLLQRDPQTHKCIYPSRQAMIVNVYDDMVVFERHEVGEGGKLGPDWVMPVDWGTGNGERCAHPFSREELKKAIGEPQFRKRAKLTVVLSLTRCDSHPMVGRVAPNAPKAGGGLGASRPTDADNGASRPSGPVPGIKLKIPLADGNPDSRVYAYDVEITGDNPKKPVLKSVYFEGVNCGMGHEPNKGVTALSIPKSELPKGRRLTISVTPLSSLGTKGKPISARFNA